MQIKANEATVKTAVVEIKSLTISGKQVTLAVFRQLKQAKLINPDTANLNGTPWGTVNYHADKCGEYPDHLHVVWQKGDELFRDIVFPRPPGDQLDNFESWVAGLFEELIIARALDEDWKPENKPEYNAIGVPHGYVMWMSHNGYRCRISVPDYLHSFWYGSGYTPASTLKIQAAAHEKIVDNRSARPLSEIRTEIDKAVTELRNLKSKWTEHYKTLSQLDQLFIAV